MLAVKTCENRAKHGSPKRPRSGFPYSDYLTATWSQGSGWDAVVLWSFNRLGVLNLQNFKKFEEILNLQFQNVPEVQVKLWVSQRLQ